MKDLQAHARKLRADAAECLVLSNLVTEERRLLFARIAEHLNSLALEIESEVVTNVAGEPNAVVNKQEAVVRDLASLADHPKASRSWNRLPWLLLLSSMVIAGSVFWATRQNAKESLSATNLPPKTEPLRAPRDEANQQLAAFLSDEKGERKEIRDQLSVLITRLDGLAKELDDLKTFRALDVPQDKGAAGQEDKSPAPEAKSPAAEEQSIPAPRRPAAAERMDGAPPATASPIGEQIEQVGAISPTRAELDLRKPTIGPAGCTHFRSFDPVSGTYTTFDGRQRECRSSASSH
jgi:BA14K-like protein